MRRLAELEDCLGHMSRWQSVRHNRTSEKPSRLHSEAHHPSLDYLVYIGHWIIYSSGAGSLM